MWTRLEARFDLRGEGFKPARLAPKSLFPGAFQTLQSYSNPGPQTTNYL